MFIIHAIWWGFLLFVMYTLGWFLFSSFLFIATKGQAPAMRMSLAAVLGVMTALFHIVVCAVKGGVCG